MKTKPCATLLATAALAGCLSTGDPNAITAEAPEKADPPEVSRRANSPDALCQATEIVPAVYEQVMGQVQVVQAQTDATGKIVQPAIYRNAPVPRLVTPRREEKFDAPCPNLITQEFIASLQRALYARGYLKGAITGQLDAATRTALRNYQKSQGLNSDQISLQTAQELGLVEVGAPDG